jgi:VPDSG-CTERM motif
MKTEMMRAKLILLAVVLSLAAGSGAMANVLYSQGTDLNGGYSSQNDTGGGNGNFATVYDNFTLGGNSAITNVMFTGSYFNPPAQGSITAFTINFYSDAGGMPGGLLQSFNMAGAANETSIGPDNAGDPTFNYSFDLSAAFNALGGTQYWISIVPDLAFPPQWGWESATGGDGVSYQDFFGGRDALDVDLAFTLNGNVSTGVPDSGTTVFLLGCALIVLGLVSRGRVLATAKR